jgi:hypothetical protein
MHGVWTTLSASVHSSPQEVWIFRTGQEPPELDAISTASTNSVVHGYWGYKPGADPVTRSPEEVWFYAPQEPRPSYFTPQGIWMLPMVKQNVSDIRLLFEGKKLDDNHTLSDFRIKHGSTLQLEPMQIKIQTPDGKTIQIDIKATDTICAVKQRVKEKEGTPRDEQRPLSKGTELEDGPTTTLADYGIKHGSTLDLEPTKINVQSLEGRIIRVIVKPSDTMGEIKKKIKQQTEIPVEEQWLVWNGKELEGGTTVKDCRDLEHGSTLDLEGMTIRLELPDGRNTISLNVKPSDKVKDIKQRSKTRRVFPFTSNDSSLAKKYWTIVSLCRITISNMGIRYIWNQCKFLSRHPMAKR